MEADPIGGDVFDVMVDNELVFSKKQLGRQSEVDEIRQLIKARL